jgi:hypothetical protein
MLLHKRRGGTASDACTDTAYRSKANDNSLADRGKTRWIHRGKPAGHPMPKRAARVNARKATVRASVDHVFAQRKARMKLDTSIYRFSSVFCRRFGEVSV